MGSYNFGYAAAWVVAVVGVVSGAIAGYGHFTPVAPSWLTSDVQGTAAIIMGICGGLELLLPQLQRTPALRRARYLTAMAGVLPRDLQDDKPTLVYRGPPEQL